MAAAALALRGPRDAPRTLPHAHKRSGSVHGYMMLSAALFGETEVRVERTLISNFMLLLYARPAVGTQEGGWAEGKGKPAADLTPAEL